MNLPEAEVPTVIFRHRVLLSKERAAVDTWNCLIFGRPVVKVFLRSRKKCNARAKKVRRLAWRARVGSFVPFTMMYARSMERVAMSVIAFVLLIFDQKS